jgi:Protein of Unknown function (DUF2784)
VFNALAAAVVVVHLLFVVFVVAGGVLVLRWPRIAWIHLPAAAWGTFIELSGRVCPLTPLEGALRRRAGLEDYAGDFIANYVFPFLYPAGLTRQAQILMAGIVIAVNVVVYGYAFYRQRMTPKT